MTLSYRELQRRLQLFEPTIGEVDRSAPKKTLQKIYDQAIAENASLLQLIESEKAPESLPPEQSSPPNQNLCPVCNGDIFLTDNWWQCSRCPHKFFRR